MDREMAKILGTILTIIVAFVAILLVGLSAFGNAQCKSQWPDRKPRFSLVTKCTIEVDGKRIPSDNYRVL